MRKVAGPAVISMPSRSGWKLVTAFKRNGALRGRGSLRGRGTEYAGNRAKKKPKDSLAR